MKKLFTLLLVLVTVLSLKAATVPVSTYAELSAALAAAADGDVIELTNESAVYDGVGVNLNVTKKIIIRAAVGLTKKPELKGFGFILNVSGAALHIEGVKAYYDAPGSATFTDSKYFIQAVAVTGTFDYIRVVNCDISNYGRGLIRADNTSNIATISELLVDNCTVTNTSAVSASYSAIGVKTALITKATIKNTTFSGCKSGVYYSEVVKVPVQFLMQNVTIYNCGSTGAKEIVRLNKSATSTDVPDATSTFTLDKVNISGCYAMDYAASIINIVNTNAGCKALNCIFNGVTTSATPYNVTWTESSLYTTITTFNLDANFKISADQPLKDLYDAGTIIGDPRGYPMTVIPSTSVKKGASVDNLVVKDGSVLFAQPTDVEIYTITGKLILNLQNVSSAPTSGLGKGIYLVKYSQQGNVGVQKIVVR